MWVRTVSVATSLHRQALPGMMGMKLGQKPGRVGVRSNTAVNCVDIVTMVPVKIYEGMSWSISTIGKKL